MIFGLWTALVMTYDVQPIGPGGSAVGLATVNQFLFQRFGVQTVWKYVTDGLEILAILIACGFAAEGLRQLICLKRIRKVDAELRWMGVVYLLMLGFDLLFEQLAVNGRPILVEGELEASYPSSHTLLVVCVVSTAAMALRRRYPQQSIGLYAKYVACGLGILMAMGRILSGLHWFSDVVGGLFLAAALAALYRAGTTRADDLPL